MTGRHELKYYINYSDFLQLRSRLLAVMKSDEHSESGEGYRVRSLYFDNYSDKALREKVDGINEREKFRIRFYKDMPTFIRLEKKSKKSGICYKQSAVITKEECENILNGHYEVLKQRNHPLLVEFYTKICNQHLRPKNIVDYKREAFVFAAGNVRVTFDYDIRSGMQVYTFLDPQIVTVPINGVIILEVKYDAFLPEIIRGMVALSGRQSSAFSKYAVTRLI